tara:strand:- start:1071 stop:1541 length:471 start_codon:yes stop_codon:yes gene_type:complete
MGRLQRWADGVLFEPTAIAIGVTYGGYFVASLAALVCMAAVPVDEQWPLDFAMYTVFVTSGLHFVLTALGFAVMDGYEAHPVDPVWAFLFADYLQAGALGAAVASYALEPTERSAAYAATGVTMAAQLLCFYKTYSLVTDVRAGRRDRFTGRKNKL